MAAMVSRNHVNLGPDFCVFCYLLWKRLLIDACLIVKSSDSVTSIHCSPPGSSVHWISQAIILKWVPFPHPGDLPDPGIEPRSPVSPALAGGFFTTEPHGKPLLIDN